MFILEASKRRSLNVEGAANNDFQKMDISSREAKKIGLIVFRSVYGRWIVMKNYPFRIKKIEGYWVIWGNESSRFAHGHTLGMVINPRNGKVEYFTY